MAVPCRGCSQMVGVRDGNARIAITGGSLATMLHQVTMLAPNGLPLWASTTFIPMTLPRDAAVSSEVARRLHAAWKPKWRATPQAAITPEALLRALEPAIKDGRADARPGIISYLCSTMHTADPEDLAGSVRHALGEVECREPSRDTLIALYSRPRKDRLLLREAATREIAAAELDHEPFAALRLFLSLMCEHRTSTEPLRLLAPYPKLVLRFLDEDGYLTADICGNYFGEPRRWARRSLVQLLEARTAITAAERAQLSRVVLDRLAMHHIGVQVPGKRELRALATAEEFRDKRSMHYYDREFFSHIMPHLPAVLQRVDAGKAVFADTIGWEVLEALGRFARGDLWKEHEIYSRQQVITSITNAAVAHLARVAGDRFSRDDMGALQRKTEPRAPADGPAPTA